MQAQVEEPFAVVEEMGRRMNGVAEQRLVHGTVSRVAIGEPISPPGRGGGPNGISPIRSVPLCPPCANPTGVHVRAACDPRTRAVSRMSSQRSSGRLGVVPHGAAAQLLRDDSPRVGLQAPETTCAPVRHGSERPCHNGDHGARR